MFRAIFELLITIAVVLVARAVLTSVLRGLARAASQSYSGTAPSAAQPRGQSSSGGDLHKDPVCGTYVAEAAAVKRRVDGQVFYYCSQACYQKHSLITR